jgi:putative RNA 2'-phosphotransferase
MDTDLVSLSKFLSLVLRHRPQKLGLTLDEGGWVSVDTLLAEMQKRGIAVDRTRLDRVVAENDKQRFSYNADGSKIRANQGHSIPVELGLQPRTPPDLLYHGTAARNIASIREQGLLKGRRQSVHLSLDEETARKVGSRHGQPVVLVVQAGRMASDGYLFTCSENGVWLTDHIPPYYIQF